MSDKEYTAEGIVEYFEGLVEYMRKLGYEDPRDKRYKELKELLVRWELSYTDGMASDDLRELYLTTVEKLDD
jgi:hypothetical protein